MTASKPSNQKLTSHQTPNHRENHPTSTSNPTQDHQHQQNSPNSALTFSTLLSSQEPDTPREPHGPRQGATPTAYGAAAADVKARSDRASPPRAFPSYPPGERRHPQACRRTRAGAAPRRAGSDARRVARRCGRKRTPPRSPSAAAAAPRVATALGRRRRQQPVPSPAAVEADDGRRAPRPPPGACIAASTRSAGAPAGRPARTAASGITLGPVISPAPAQERRDHPIAPQSAHQGRPDRRRRDRRRPCRRAAQGAHAHVQHMLTSLRSRHLTPTPLSPGAASSVRPRRRATPATTSRVCLLGAGACHSDRPHKR